MDHVRREVFEMNDAVRRSRIDRETAMEGGSVVNSRVRLWRKCQGERRWIDKLWWRRLCTEVRLFSKQLQTTQNAGKQRGDDFE